MLVAEIYEAFLGSQVVSAKIWKETMEIDYFALKLLAIKINKAESSYDI